MSDNDLMPWGKHKGIKMIDVPEDYLLWLYENNKCDKQVKDYIVDNMQAIKQFAVAYSHPAFKKNFSI